MDSTIKCEFVINSSNYQKFIKILNILFEDTESNLEINVSQNSNGIIEPEVNEPEVNEQVELDESEQFIENVEAVDLDYDTETSDNEEVSNNNLNVLTDANYYLVSQYRIKKPKPSCGEKGKKSIEWFVKKVRDTPELMLNCKYCSKTYWKKTVDSLLDEKFLKHQEAYQLKKNYVEYTDNIRSRS